MIASLLTVAHENKSMHGGITGHLQEQTLL